MRVNPLGWAAMVWVGLCSLGIKTEADNPMSRWSWRHPEPQGLDLWAVTASGGKYVAVGESGTILTSSDAEKWTLVSQSQFPTLAAVSAGGGLFVAAGENGTIVTSTNGHDWTARSSGTTGYLLAVAYNWLRIGLGSSWLIVGENGVNLTSNDGIQWSVRTNFTTQTLMAIAEKNDGQLVVAGAHDSVFLWNGGTWTGVDLTSWIGPSDPNGIPRSYHAAVAVGSTVVLGGWLWDSRVNASFVVYSGGTGWTESYIAPGDPLGPRISGLAFGGRFVAVGPTWALDGSYPGDVLVSTNGWDWVVQYSSENFMSSVCYGGKYVAVGPFGSIITSTNGLDWSRKVVQNMTSLRAIAASDDLCLLAGEPQRKNDFYGFFNPSAFATRDGTSWQATFTNKDGLGIEDLTQSQGLFVGVRGNNFTQPNNDVLTTTDGVQWVTTNLTNAPPLHGCGHANGLFFVVGERGAIWVSTNGSSWTDRSVSLQRGDEGFNALARGNGLYVAAGNAIALSTNGWDWSLETAQLPAPIRRMLFADGIFVATGMGNSAGGRTICTSTDGLKWVVRYQEAGPSYSAAVGNVAYGNGIFLASCGAFVWSNDGLQWHNCDSALAAAAMYDYLTINPPVVGFFRGRFVLAGPHGHILQSDDTYLPALNPRSALRGFHFDFRSKAGDPYRIQNSLNLSDWRTVDEALGDGGTNEFIDLGDATTPYRFFRVVSP